jgi:hypothetical protein
MLEAPIGEINSLFFSLSLIVPYFPSLYAVHDFPLKILVLRENFT